MIDRSSFPPPADHEQLGRRYKFVGGDAPFIVSSLRGDTYRLKGVVESYILPVTVFKMLVYEGLMEEV